MFAAAPPQQYAASDVVMPQVTPSPAVRLVKLRPPLTGAGVEREIVVLSPSSPRMLSPQQRIRCERATPQVCRAPAAIAVKCEPATSTGRVDLATPPVPSCPASL